jgi:molybdate transport system substrate-binding protein
MTETSLTGISSMATRQVLAEVADAWRYAGGELAFESVGGVEAAQRVRDGETFDIAVLSAEAIDKLIAAGRIVAGSQIDLAHSGVAIAIRAGAPRPTIATEAALREALLSARTIGYSTGPSGVALQKLFERWGIAETIRARLVQAPPGMPVGTLIARGDVALGFQQLSELMHLDGIDVIGPMPPGLEIVTTFSAGICTTSTQAAAARALLSFMSSPAADEAKRRHGMQPA